MPIGNGSSYLVSASLAESPEYRSLELQRDATFADNFDDICRQIMYFSDNFFILAKIIWKKGI